MDLKCIAAKSSSAVLALALLSGCNDGTGLSVSECETLRELHKAVVQAMCEPWGETRERVLGDLAEAALEYEASFGGGGVHDTVWDSAGEIDAKDCVKAGYADPGPKAVDPRRERARERLKNIPPPPLPERSTLERPMREPSSCVIE